ncbi:DUF45 domain-containing protein [Candidatus Woesearchaeota archaeon]|nr:DUF45 domain-containing protein [Candidatus Woesearchaeota archaeon]
MRSDLIRESFVELFPTREFLYTPELKYSGRFKGYNGNIRLSRDKLVVSLSRQWRSVSRDIQKGIIQELLTRLFRVKKKTMAMELYHSFLKNVHHTIPKTHDHPLLAASFERVNDRFFDGLMEQPNLVLGRGTTKLGSYEYGTDTIMISECLFADEELLDYVMYHEMLHKKHKFSQSRHHTKAFREDERKFGDYEQLEKRLGSLVRKAKRRKSFRLW